LPEKKGRKKDVFAICLSFPIGGLTEREIAILIYLPPQIRKKADTRERGKYPSFFPSDRKREGTERHLFCYGSVCEKGKKGSQREGDY